MILMYHKVNKSSAGSLTVSENFFLEQINSLKDKKIVYLDDYDPFNKDNAVITFDDGYKDILYYALPHLKKLNIPFEIFLVGDFLKLGDNGNNEFLNSGDLSEIVNSGYGRCQWHTKTHPHLEQINDENVLEQEIKLPQNLLGLDKNGFKWFAYPFCSYNDKVIEIVKRYYRGARSGKGLGNTDIYTLESLKVDNQTVL